MSKAPIRITRLASGEAAAFGALVALLRDVLGHDGEPPPPAGYHKALLMNPFFTAFAARMGEEVIGGLTAYELPAYMRPGAELFIYDIAVHPAHRRKGIGRQLIRAAAVYCEERQIRAMFVSADAGDEDALRFYRATQGQEAPVAHFTYPAGE